jgi:hypothetical protein
MAQNNFVDLDALAIVFGLDEKLLAFERPDGLKKGH